MDIAWILQPGISKLLVRGLWVCMWAATFVEFRLRSALKWNVSFCMQRRYSQHVKQFRPFTSYKLIQFTTKKTFLQDVPA